MARGGARPGAGRKKGKVSKAKREIAEMAKEHAEAALLTLVEVSGGSGSPAARVSAATAILDRAYGKPSQAVDVGADVTGSVTVSWKEVMAEAEVFRPVEFCNMCAMSLALGKEVQTDSSIRAQIDGMTYYFIDGDAKSTFMKDSQGNLAKARAYRNRKSYRPG